MIQNVLLQKILSPKPVNLGHFNRLIDLKDNDGSNVGVYGARQAVSLLVSANHEQILFPINSPFISHKFLLRKDDKTVN